MITFTKAPPKLAHYTSAVLATATAEIARLEMSPNSSICILAKGNNDFTITCTQIDTIDDVEFEVNTYAITSATPATIWHRGGVGVLIEITAGASNVTPDVRVFGMSQP